MFPKETTDKLAELLPPQAISTLWKANQRAELLDYFFRTKTDLKWFFPAKLLGYFSPASAPSPIETEKHTYSIPQWNVLPYLESVARQLPALPPEQRDQLSAELLEIIKDVSAARKAALDREPNSFVLDNHRTWYHFVRILLEFPNDRVTPEILNLLPLWLDSRFDASLAGSEIAKKLLGKFLSAGSPADIAKAEIITKALTAVSWQALPSEARAFGELEKPKLRLDDYWIMESFVERKYARALGARCSDDLIFNIAEKLQEMSRREKPHTLQVEIGDKDEQLMVRAVQPVRRTIKAEIGRVKKADHWTTFDWSSFKPVAEFSLQSDDDEAWVKEILNKIEAQASSEVASSNEQAVRDYVHGFFDDHSYIWLKSLSVSDIRVIDSPKELLAVLLRELLLGRAEAGPAKTIPVLNELAGARFGFQVFKRLVIYVIGKSWRELGPLFWTLNEEWKGALFESPYFEAETYDLLSENESKFAPAEKAALKAIIAAGPKDLPADEHRELRATFWKQKWYGSLKGDPEFLALYEECRAATKTEAKPRHTEVTVRWGYGKTPLTSDQIVKMPNKELAAFVPNFEAKKKESWDDPTPEALALSFQGASAQDPNKFAADISTFADLGYRYMYEILSGILDAVEKKPASIDWPAFLTALPVYLSREEFWLDLLPARGAERYGADHQWVVGLVGKIIRAASRTTDIIPADLSAKMQESLFICIDRLTPSNDAENVKDPVTRSLNSAAGKILEALLELSLRVARENQQANREPFWSAPLKEKYAEALARPFLEAHEVLGRHMGSFSGLEKGWLREQIVQHENADEGLWYAFFAGYLHFGVYGDIVPLMEAHYKRALVTPMNEDRTEQALVDHIATDYLYLNERSLDAPGGLLSSLIESGNAGRIKKLIGDLWMRRPDAPRLSGKAVIVEVKDGKPEPKVVEGAAPVDDEAPVELADLDRKVLAVWRRLVGIYGPKPRKSDEDKAILSDLAKLTVYAPELTAEIVGWIKTSVEFPDQMLSSSFILDYLNRLKDQGDKERNATAVAEILTAMLLSFTPDYKAEDVQELVEFVFVSGDEEAKAKAAEICNTYAQRGRAELLRGVFLKHVKPAS